jgi:hypothetical protein
MTICIFEHVQCTFSGDGHIMADSPAAMAAGSGKAARLRPTRTRIESACRGTWALVTIDQFRHWALQTV